MEFLCQDLIQTGKSHKTNANTKSDSIDFIIINGSTIKTLLLHIKT